MSSGERDGADSPFNVGSAEEMAKYGITRVPVDYFHYKDFRYTNLKDAIAQAERHIPIEQVGEV